MNKNKMTLREVYRTVGRTLLEQSENDFIAEVDVDLYMDVENDLGVAVVGRRLNIIYNIEIDYRSYGIKEINAHNVKIMPFQLEDMDSGEIIFTQDKIVDVSGIRIERGRESSKYGSFFPTSIDLHMDRGGNVVVEKSTVYF